MASPDTFLRFFFDGDGGGRPPRKPATGHMARKQIAYTAWSKKVRQAHIFAFIFETP